MIEKFYFVAVAYSGDFDIKYDDIILKIADKNCDGSLWGQEKIFGYKDNIRYIAFDYNKLKYAKSVAEKLKTKKRLFSVSVFRKVYLCEPEIVKNYKGEISNTFLLFIKKHNPIDM
jgi:hypothetical protein